jgi:hypothetical protein
MEFAIASLSPHTVFAQHLEQPSARSTPKSSRGQVVVAALRGTAGLGGWNGADGGSARVQVDCWIVDYFALGLQGGGFIYANSEARPGLVAFDGSFVGPMLAARTSERQYGYFGLGLGLGKYNKLVDHSSEPCTWTTGCDFESSSGTHSVVSLTGGALFHAGAVELGPLGHLDISSTGVPLGTLSFAIGFAWRRVALGSRIDGSNARLVLFGHALMEHVSVGGAAMRSAAMRVVLEPPLPSGIELLDAVDQAACRALEDLSRFNEPGGDRPVLVETDTAWT